MKTVESAITWKQ